MLRCFPISLLFLSIPLTFTTGIGIGAIRWDDWYNTSTDPNDSGLAIERALSPLQWRDRVPWYCEILPNTNITCNNNQRTIMDQEIQDAVENGLNFWAFDTYPNDTSLALSRLLYMNSTSSYKSYLQWCHLLQTGWITQGGLADWPTKIAEYVNNFNRSDYYKVHDPVTQQLRPLVFLFSMYENAWDSNGWNSWITAFTMLNNASIAYGSGQPYYAVQTFDVSDGWDIMRNINGNSTKESWLLSALSSYAVVGGASYPDGGSYSQLIDANINFWNTIASSTTADIIVPLTAGWDPRPMNETNLPWQNYTNPSWVNQPTPTDLYNFTSIAIEWSLKNKNTNPTQTILISAYNEYAEGHWIGPVFPEYGGKDRLVAIGQAIKNYTSSSSSSSG